MKDMREISKEARALLPLVGDLLKGLDTINDAVRELTDHLCSLISREYPQLCPRSRFLAGNHIGGIILNYKGSIYTLLYPREILESSIPIFNATNPIGLVEKSKTGHYTVYKDGEELLAEATSKMTAEEVVEFVKTYILMEEF